MKQYITLRITHETHHDLKIIAAFSDETMIETIARLARQEYERIQREEKHHVPGSPRLQRQDRPTR